MEAYFIKMNSESNPDAFWTQFGNENHKQFWNQILNQFENKFGIDSRKKIQEFSEKYPLIFLGLLGQITTEYLAKKPEIMVEIYQELLDKITGRSEEETVEKKDQYSRWME